MKGHLTVVVIAACRTIALHISFICSRFYCFIWLLLSLIQLHITFSGDGKDSTNGEISGTISKKSSATRMVTRLRNPDSKLSQLKSQQVAAAVHEANKGFKEGKEVKKR